MIRAYDILGCLGVSMLLCGLVSLPISVIMSSQYIWNMGLGGIVAGLVVMCLALVIAPGLEGQQALEDDPSGAVHHRAGDHAACRSCAIR